MARVIGCVVIDNMFDMGEEKQTRNILNIQMKGG